MSIARGRGRFKEQGKGGLELLSLSLTAILIVKPFWKLMAMCGTRKYLTGTIQRLFPGAYGDVLMYFDMDSDNDNNIDFNTHVRDDTRSRNCGTNAEPEPKSFVAITIDDGLSRGGPGTSMTKDVLDVLKRYNATATFFVCTDYVKIGSESKNGSGSDGNGDGDGDCDCDGDGDVGNNDQRDEIISLLSQGHELGNHMQADLHFHYHKLQPKDFEIKLKEAEDLLEEMRNLPSTKAAPTPKPTPRWYRPPQGIMTTKMKETVDKMGLSSVFGDCYCDDWKFAQDVDKFVTANNHNICNNSSSISNNIVDGNSINVRNENKQFKKQGDDDHDNEEEDVKNDICRTIMRGIGKLMLSQAQPGSIAIFHMPERGFREGTIYALEEFLRVAKEERGWRCCSLTNALRLHEERLLLENGDKKNSPVINNDNDKVTDKK